MGGRACIPSLVEGLTVELAEYRDVIGALAWWLVHKKLGRTSFSPRLAHLYDAIGVRIHDLPATPDKILDALARKEQEDPEDKI